MADVWLSDEEQQTRDLVRALARERIAPLAAHVDESETYPAQQLELLGAQGLMGARGHKGVTAFLVEPTFAGFEVGKHERKLGIRGSPTVALHLADCEVPVENRSASRAMPP